MLRVENVRKFIDQEVLAAGSQLGWAKKVGARSVDVNKTLTGNQKTRQKEPILRLHAAWLHSASL